MPAEAGSRSLGTVPAGNEVVRLKPGPGTISGGRR